MTIAVGGQGARGEDLLWGKGMSDQEGPLGGTFAQRDQIAEDDGPLYMEGMAHLQAGAWAEAIRTFEELAEHEPENLAVQRALAEARFKAGLDATSRVRAKRWIIPWRSVALRLFIVVAAVVLVVQGTRFIQQEVTPALAQARVERQRAQLLLEARAYLQAGDLAAAEARFQELLAAVPNHQEALAGLEQVERERWLLGLYQKAVALEEQGDDAGALIELNEIATQAPRYRDVGLRITAIMDRQGMDGLFAAAEADYKAGERQAAVAKYERLRALDVEYRAELVTERLFELYFALGSELIERDPPAPNEVPRAIDHFGKALVLRPRQAEARLEQQLAQRFLGGQSMYEAERWNDAITRLRAVYDVRPDYLSGLVARLLYDAYIHSGDAYRDAEDLEMANEQYRLAAELQVDDPSLAQARLAALLPTATPTPLPTTTPAPAPPPSSGAQYSAPPPPVVVYRPAPSYSAPPPRPAYSRGYSPPPAAPPAAPPPTAEPTPVPTATPPPPPPPPTAKPVVVGDPFQGAVVGWEPNCGGNIVKGFVRNSWGEPINMGVVKLNLYGTWVDAPVGSAAKNQGAGWYEWGRFVQDLLRDPITVALYAPDGGRLSNEVVVPFTPGSCEPGGAGQQVATVEFICTLPEVCG